MTAVNVYACHAVLKTPHNFSQTGGWGCDWFTDYGDTHSRQPHILSHQMILKCRLKFHERLEYATITLHIIRYTLNRVGVFRAM